MSITRPTGDQCRHSVGSGHAGFTPEKGAGKAPVMVMFRGGGLRVHRSPRFRAGAHRPRAAITATEQLIADGWATHS